jgi:membrane peptidoglycan carboxypeptidase
MVQPKTKAGRDLVARSPELRDAVLAIEAEAMTSPGGIDEERLGRAIARLWPSRRARDAAGGNARAIVVAYNAEQPED